MIWSVESSAWTSSGTIVGNPSASSPARVSSALYRMLVIGAGLMIRTVYNLATVDAGFARSRLVTFQMSLATADYPQPASRAQLYQRLLDKLRGVAGVQGASAMPMCRGSVRC